MRGDDIDDCLLLFAIDVLKKMASYYAKYH